MTITLNSDGSILTFTSTLLSSSEVKTITGLKLKTKLNCSSTSTTIDLDDLIPDVANSSFDLSSIVYYDDVTKTTYCDGVYYFEIEVTYNISGEAIEEFIGKESGCKFIDTAIKCDLLTYYSTTKDMTALFYYNALAVGSICDSCNCAELCSLYSELKTLLGNANIGSTDSDCGCN